MKKILFATAAAVLLVGCSGADTYNNNRETRYFAYVGEPAAVLYDNFGTPTKGVKYSDTERALVFHTQDIEHEWAYTDYRYCDITFYLTNNIVTGWQLDGNQCAINEEDTGFWSRIFAGGGTAGGVATDAFDSTSDNGGMFVLEDDAFSQFDLNTDAGFDTPAPQQPMTEPLPTSGTSVPYPSDIPAGHVIADDAF